MKRIRVTQTDLIAKEKTLLFQGNIENITRFSYVENNSKAITVVNILEDEFLLTRHLGDMKTIMHFQEDDDYALVTSLGKQFEFDIVVCHRSINGVNVMFEYKIVNKDEVLGHYIFKISEVKFS